MKKNKINKKNDFSRLEIVELISHNYDFDRFKVFLEEHSGLDSVDEFGRSALINCIIAFRNPVEDCPFANEYAKKLIELGADINKPDLNGYVALHHCILSKNYEMFDYLLTIPNINIKVEPGLLGYALSHDIDYTPNIIKLLDLGLDPFKKGKIFSAYQILVGIDNGTVKIGDQTKNVKPILEHIKQLYGDRTE
ncbi:ankyrin repeat protein [Prevotella sp. ICM33]|jgi:hypothetical protein|uniref:ankyrin repeat domain-containing protein n=1 Tax=Prevotella sp. ICM33 TaxID=1161412 RepID=UPI000445BB28|nr:ankyrin repeat domain-containing protein [Prevotella sp. ICM33]ETT00240.1 ankyrin repeat protein [Prevotella sp. ICM33]